MNKPGEWLLYGASGYTGRRIAEEARRRGLRPILAGRDPRKIRSLAERLGCPARVFPLRSVAGITEDLEGVRAVLNCAGPFSATAEPMMDACLAAGVHYLDITGEIAVIEAAAARHQRAVAAGVSLIPAVGFDVVPSDCLAAMLAERLPGATHLQLAFRLTGSPSAGTAKSMLEALPRGGRARIAERIVRVPVAWKTREIPFRDGRRMAVTVPWGDVASAWHTTGIPNVEGVPRHAGGPDPLAPAVRAASAALAAQSDPRVLPNLDRPVRSRRDRRASGPDARLVLGPRYGQCGPCG